ncbi:serine/threonine-protein kinase HipA [Chitinophaga costaii]|uniref:Serine/threonine-protein kinase HipA n=1 Tax=Chitinophaga costaii TaxID=1335309 RepID=A0A1C4ATF3_9BACT|nr:HipA N-terminal domain-containing protein [Chitinophaga costaii]PUZ26738.1 phosphatidylinositol kinase [Chitinophaga costaii]SCB97905.1 serine/threonine-protein kinase HipA [Chitinophaga costaii]
MRAAKILFKGQEAGVLTQHDDGTFTFQYNASWVEDSSKPSISLTLPKIASPYHSSYLFPFFYNMLPEGSNKQVVCQLNHLDKTDYFGLLLTIAQTDTIGAVTVSKIE